MRPMARAVPLRLKELNRGNTVESSRLTSRWPALEEVPSAGRGSYGYLTGYLSEDDHDTMKPVPPSSTLGDDSENWGAISRSAIQHDSYSATPNPSYNPPSTGSTHTVQPNLASTPPATSTTNQLTVASLAEPEPS